MKLVFDAGALLALERDDRRMWQRYKAARAAGTPVVSHGGVVGQAWRGRGAREALLAMALKGITILPLDDALGRAAGALLAEARRDDVIDAALVLLANDGDQILTSDPDDIAILALFAERDVEVITV